MIVRPVPEDLKKDHFQWLQGRAKVGDGTISDAIEAVDSEGRIHGMVGYSGWTPNGVVLTIALDNPACLRHLVGPGFGIPFVELGKKVAICTVLSSNARSMELVRHLGFREVHRGRNWWSKGVDMVVFEMRRADCRFIKQEEAA